MCEFCEPIPQTQVIFELEDGDEELQVSLTDAFEGV
jgi:hypothetical protein